MSCSESQHKSVEQEEKPKPYKAFVTNLSSEVPIPQLEAELWKKFQKYGKLDSIVAKKGFNNQYSYAFVEYKQGVDATQAVQQLNNTLIADKKMKVELQDNSRRRKAAQTCFHCGKTGHFARNCPQPKDREEKRSSSESSKHKKKSKKKRRRHHSSSSESSSPKKKQKKKHSSKKIKKSKHKKRRHSSSSSD